MPEEPLSAATSRQGASRAWRFGALVLLVGSVLAAYGGTLDAWFHPIDDALHLAGALTNEAASPHARPVQHLWNRLLWGLARDQPRPWRLASLLLHLGSALCLLRVLRELGLREPAAVGGALAFAVAFAPNEAVAWNAAACGLLSVFFMLVSAVLWTSHLKGAGRLPYLGSLLALGLAVGSKEDAVLAGPLLIGLHVVLCGRASLARPRGWLRYVPFALLALAYLGVAFRPELWSERAGVGTYALGRDTLHRMAGTLGILAWPRHLTLDGLPAWMPALGVLLTVGLLVLVRPHHGARGIALLGLTLMVAGILPVLPGPFEAAAASRYGYPCAIGLGLAVGALLEAAPCWGERKWGGRWVSVGIPIAIAAWLAASTYSIRSTVDWRFVRASHGYRALVEDTRRALVAWIEEHPGGQVYAVDPGLWNPRDFECGLRVFARDLAPRVRREDLRLEDVSSRVTQLSGSADCVVLVRNAHGAWQRFEPGQPWPEAQWRASVVTQEERGGATRLPCFLISARSTPRREG